MLTQFDFSGKERENRHGWRRIEDGLPTAGESVLYRTPQHQALGVYEGANRWRCSNGEVEDNPVLLWQPFYSF
jgi:hypothetical protein